MLDQEFRKRMTIANHLAEGLSPETEQQIKELLVKEYIKGKDIIHRNMFEKIEQFLHISDFVNMVGRLDEKEAQKLRPYREFLEGYKANMIYLRIGEELKPLFIRCAQVYDLCEKADDDEDYLDFLNYFYFCVIPKTENNNYYYIDTTSWKYIKKTYGVFLERLLEEEKEFYTEVGFYSVEKKIRNIKRNTQHSLAKMSEEEKNKKTAFSTEDGRWISIVG